MIKAVLFDLDGTLVNSLEDLAVSANFALQIYGYPIHETEKYKYFIGDGLLKLVERTLPEEDRSKDNINKLFQTVWKHYSENYVVNTVAYNGIAELLAELKQKGYKLAVVTNKPHEMAVNIVKALIGDAFDIICGKLDNYPPKPDPALTLKTMNDLGVNPDECVFVGDSGIDAANAVNAGCVGIGVLWGFRTKEELLHSGADYIVNNPFEILEILDKI